DGKKAFESEIVKLEKDIKENTNLKPEVKKKLEEILEEAKKEQEKWTKPEDFKKALEDLKKKVEEAKKVTNNQISSISKNEYDFWKDLNVEAIINSEENIPPTNNAQPNKNNEFDEIIKNLKDILVLSKDKTSIEGLKLLKEDSKKYSLWYDALKRNIVMVEGKEPPFGKNSKTKKWILFEFNEKASKVAEPIRLVNDEKPTYKKNKLSTNLVFNFDEKKENIIIKYKVAEDLGKNKEPIISSISNESKIQIKSAIPEMPSIKPKKELEKWNKIFIDSPTGADIRGKVKDYRKIKEYRFWRNLNIEAFIIEEGKEIEIKPAAPKPPAAPSTPSAPVTPIAPKNSSKIYKMPELYIPSENKNLFEVTDKKALKEEFEKALKANKDGAIRIDKGVIKIGKKDAFKAIKISASIKNPTQVNTHGKNENIGWIFEKDTRRKGILLKKESDNKYILSWKLITTEDNKVTKKEKTYTQVFEL
ncbi:hypothetical protein, partial [Metamycoplasma auris]|uniref:hypothetical protein n=1 Tax=Metamycoplasma auris TaxID=51363 RepID=UPI0006916597